jgi:hypothetical protein
MAERGRPKALLVLTDEERQTLQRWARRAKTAQALALRAKIVLVCAEVQTNQPIAEQLGIWPQTVGKWRAGSCVSGWRACRTKTGRVDPARSPMSRSSR